MKQTKTTFGFTKSKAYGLCGAVLASMVFASTQAVHADEVTANEPVVVSDTTNPVTEEVATVTVTAQPATETEVPASNDLTNAIASVEAVGGSVVVDPSSSLGTASTPEKVKDLETKATADYKAQADDLNAKVTDYTRRQSEYQESIDSAKHHNLAKDETQGLYLTGSVDESARNSANFYKKLTLVVDNPNLTDKDILASANLYKDMPIESEGKELDTFDGTNSLSKMGKDSIPQQLKILRNPQNGSSFTIREFGRTVSGERLDVKATISRVEYIKGAQADNSELHIIPTIENGGIFFGVYGFRSFAVTFEWFNQAGQPVDLVQSYVTTDFDYGQGIAITYAKSNAELATKNFDGSEMTLDNGVYYSPQGIGFDNFKELPKGSIVTSGYGTVTYFFDGTKDIGLEGNFAQGYTFGVGVFSRAGSVKTVSKPDKVKAHYHLNHYQTEGQVAVTVVTEDGTVLSQTNSSNVPVGSSYDTSKTRDKLVKIGGKVYQLVRVEGKEKSTTTLGTSKVTYVVKEKPLVVKIPNDAPEYEKPEFHQSIPNDAPEHEMPRLDIKTVIPNDAPEYEKPKLEVPEVKEEKPVVKEMVKTSPVVKAGVATLPQTGDKETSQLAFLSVLIVSALGLIGLKKREKGQL